MHRDIQVGQFAPWLCRNTAAWFSPLLQHVDIAALLIKYNTCVNATDKWAFTPLHEAAQKGRTQLCALLLAHGADPTMKNQEGQTPLDLATVIIIIIVLRLHRNRKEQSLFPVFRVKAYLLALT